MKLTIFSAKLKMVKYMARKTITVAVAGQPNCGKSTIFNMLTGGTARVGNYPGITVERMEGVWKNEAYKIKFIDLPGTYSLTSYSLEEVVARKVLIEEKPDVVLCMLDATALERSLYLAIQIIEIGIPVVIGLNMMDEVRREGIQIDTDNLSKKLLVPIIECIARKSIGKDALIQAIINTYENPEKDILKIDISYGSDLDPALDKMESIIKDNKFLTKKHRPRWLAIKYMEADSYVINSGRKEDEKISDTLELIVKDVEKHTEKSLKTYPEALVSDYRYGYITSLLKGGIITRPNAFRRNISEVIDKFITSRVLGPLIMVGVLYLLFWFTFTLGAYPQELLQNSFGLLGHIGSQYISNELLRSLVVSGIIDGVGAVLSFAPLILIMFAMLCFLEDLGYMARVAYMLDKVFRTFGLHGASVMPFIVAGGIPGGCAVPGVMTARTLKSPKERIATILTAPFMVCGAKTTVYLMLAETFFPGDATWVMLVLTVASWFFALIVSLALRLTILKGEPTPFIMELPPYRLPTVYGILTHTWDRVWQFVKKAGTVIFAVSIVMWVLMTFPRLPDDHATTVQPVAMEMSKLQKSAAYDTLLEENKEKDALRYSIAGRFGSFLEPITKYAGFQWQVNISLIGGFAAKEVVLSTLSTAYSLGEYNPDSDGKASDLLKSRLLSDPNWTLPTIISLFLFMLLYAPCLTTVVAMAKETSWKWAIGGTAGSLILAYVLSVIVYQVLSKFY